jgi:tetratricopeptide (TPR) repeat protein
MRAIRSFLVWVYASVAILAGMRWVIGLWSHTQPDSVPAMTHSLVYWTGKLLIPVCCLVFGMAAWTYWRKSRWAKACGMVAGLLNVAISLGMIDILHRLGHWSWMSALESFWLLLLIGFGSLVVFWAWNPQAEDATAKPAPPRIQGDGTHALLDQLPLVLTFAGCILGMNLWYRFARAQALESLPEGWFWFNLFLASLITTFVHECGHAFVARAVGIRLRGFVAGPFQWHVDAGQWLFSFKWQGFFSAEGATRINLNDPALVHRRAIAMIAAGPFANLAFGAAATWAVLHAVDAPWEPLWGLLAFISTFSLIAFVANLVPARCGDNYTDGAKLFQLLTGRTWAEFDVRGDLLLRKRGLDCLLAGQPAEAEAIFRTRLEEGTQLAQDEQVRLLVCLADSLQDQQRYSEALVYLETALALGDDTGSGQGSLSDILLVQGTDPARALALAEEAARLNFARIRQESAKNHGIAGEQMAQVRLLARKSVVMLQIGRLRDAHDSICNAMQILNGALEDSAESRRSGPKAAEVVRGRVDRMFDDLLLAYSSWMVGMALIRLDDVDRGVPYLRWARDLDPKGKFRVQVQRELEKLDGAVGAPEPVINFPAVGVDAAY